MSNAKKEAQLGMALGTAAHRLRMAILFKLATQTGHVCFRCGEPLTLESFTIEHKIPWLHSQDPVGLFFDLDNIAFSHFECNIGARRTNRKYHSREAFREADRIRGRGYWQAKTREQRQAIRRKKYLAHGK